MTATVTGPFEVRKNLTLGAGVKLYRDQTITPETKQSLILHRTGRAVTRHSTKI